MARGGKRPGAGRPKGSQSKTSLEIKAAFSKHSAKLVDRIMKLVDSDNEAVSHAATKTALEYGFGKPSQVIEGNSDSPVVHEVRHVIVDPRD